MFSYFTNQSNWAQALLCQPSLLLSHVDKLHSSWEARGRADWENSPLHPQPPTHTHTMTTITLPSYKCQPAHASQHHRHIALHSLSTDLFFVTMCFSCVRPFSIVQIAAVECYSSSRPTQDKIVWTEINLHGHHEWDNAGLTGVVTLSAQRSHKSN